MEGARSVVAGVSLAISLVALGISALTLLASPPAGGSPPARVDLELLITGRGAIGGPAESHLFDPQLLVVRRGDTVRLRVLNLSHFRHGLEFAGLGVRTGALHGGAAEVVEFAADRPGIFEYRCYLPHDPATGTCAPDHDRMVGHLVVVEGRR
ncbi:MAG: hypothetical protein QN173_07885 [Armatimonadota bacterium]|nr:hypothetical protein [Armatimonadota bacterium]MDR7437703.1 hypothetical protein [Armatimonadota bacterium]MDR7472384.1 hypothetical protein [Armatimonadota bacterium]MDR7507508.1 hypothetical protein [Armatimonadota bacterium]MDR7509767.1 hypothetical protein [Armatimonadota bacterium]